MTSSLGVLHVITAPKGGGAELLVRELNQRLPRFGIPSEAVYFNADGSLLPKEYVLGVPSRSPLSILKTRSHVKRFCRKHKQAVIHTHLTWPFFYVVIATIGLSVTLVHTEHNTTNRRRSPMFRAIDRYFYKKYREIYCISQGVKEALIAWLGEGLAPRVKLVENGARIYDLQPRKRLAGRLPRLVSVGSLTKRKGFDVAIRAIAKIKDQVECYRIIGEGPERQSLTELIEKLGLSEKVNLMGWCDGIESQLKNADLQLIPSVWEGFGLVAVEGMSTGLPIIASDVAGLREVLGGSNLDSTILIEDHRNAVDWAKAVEMMVERLNSDASLSSKSRAQAEKYTLDAMVEKYVAMYQNLCIQSDSTGEQQ